MDCHRKYVYSAVMAKALAVITFKEAHDCAAC